MKRSTPSLWTRHSLAPVLLLVTVACVPLLVGFGAINPVGIPRACIHLFMLCTAMLAGIDGPLHDAPYVIIGAGLLYAIWNRAFAVHRVIRAFRSMPVRELRRTDAAFGIASALGIADRVRIVSAHTPNPAFTFGALAPKIFIADELQTILTHGELEAVLRHERKHLREHHPARAAIGTLLADMFFWLPLLRSQSETARERYEYEADDDARVVGDLVVASAILKVAELPRDVMIVTAFVSSSILSSRVQRLLGLEPVSPRRMAPRALRTTFAAVVLVWSMSFLGAVSHASHAPGSESTCPHAGMHDAHHVHHHHG
jgi:Zn-dependent protease with chaperone function